MHGLPDLPKFNAATQTSADNDHPRSLIIEQVQKHDQLAGEVNYNRPR